MPERVMRAIGAITPKASTHTGRISAWTDELERLPVAGQQAVDRVQAGDVGRRIDPRIDAAVRRGEEVPEEEQVEQHQAGPEDRQRDAARWRGRAHVVDRARRAARRRAMPSGTPMTSDEEHRVQRQLERRREARTSGRPSTGWLVVNDVRGRRAAGPRRR